MSDEDWPEICGEIPQYHLDVYKTLGVHFKKGIPADIELSELSKYGSDAKQIQIAFNQHFANCPKCKEYCDERTEAMLLMFEIGESSSTPKETGRRNTRREFRKEHGLEIHLNGLEEYISSKSLAEVDDTEFIENSDFEEHMGECGLCQKLYTIDAEIAQETKQFRQGNKEK